MNGIHRLVHSITRLMNGITLLINGLVGRLAPQPLIRGVMPLSNR